MHRIIPVILAALLLGCGTTSQVIIPTLPVPAEPTYPTIPADDLLCLSDDAYTRLVERDAMRKAYADELRAIIEAHNEAAGRR